MELGDTGVLAAQPVNSRVDGRVDGDIVSRFATCCRALGIAVYERQRPADLAAARSGFHRADPHRPRPVRRMDRAGRRRRFVASGCWRRFRGLRRRPACCSGRWTWRPARLGFRYDTGLYLQFRATDPGRFPPRLRGGAGNGRASLPRPTRSSAGSPSAARAGARPAGSPSSSTTAPNAGRTSSSC